VRIPAACCGILGWKPSRGLISTEGLVPLSTPLDTIGVLTSSIALLSDIADLLLRQSPVVPLRRIGVLSLDVQLDETAQRAVDSAVMQVRQAGIEVQHRRLDLDPAVVRRRGLLLCEAEAAGYWGSAVDGEPAGLSPTVRELLRFGRSADAARLHSAEAVRQVVEDAVSALFRDVDALILPTLPGAPPLIDDDPVGLADLTAFVNLAGVPALSLPTSTVAPGESVPRSIQLVGSAGSDRSLIAFASSIVL
jgi:Asp-tRNA(Asn)/Glu-tRNA(Gln) amidotransferase A subunit family amidase